CGFSYLACMPSRLSTASPPSSLIYPPKYLSMLFTTADSITSNAADYQACPAVLLTVLTANGMISSLE
ncbi:hypothetical protein ACFLYB_03600, partial [Chloroflexota bacterium]